MLDVMFNLHESVTKHEKRLTVSCGYDLRTSHAVSGEFASYKVDIPKPGFRYVRTVHP